MRKTTLLKSMLLLCALIVGSGSVWADTVVSFSVSDYAASNSWVNGTAYSNITINSDLTATCVTGGNNGKYYSSDYSWRHYEGNSGAITITATSGTLKSITFTYGKGYNGVLRYGGKDIPSTIKCLDVMGQTSATFNVGHSSGENKGNVSITEITIIYGDTPALPFEFDGGIADIENTSGLMQSGLGSDYGSSPKLKFDTQGDYLILRIDNAALPDKLSFDIKGYGISGTYAFTVQWSANGSDYTDLATYSTIDGSKASKEIDISSCIGLKYIKWIYTTKASGNVALGNISVSQQTEAISTASGKNYATYVTTKALDFSSVSGAIKAYVAASEAAGANITFTGKDAVPAGTPLLIKTTTPGATVNVPVAASTPGSVGTNYLVAGDGSNVTYDAGASHFYYILTNGQFKAANNSPVAVGKAYLSLPSAALANELTVNFEDGDGDVTGIKNLTPALSQGEGVAYNLAGQRVNASHKGLVIVNGKKYLNK